MRKQTCCLWGLSLGGAGVSLTAADWLVGVGVEDHRPSEAAYALRVLPKNASGELPDVQGLRPCLPMQGVWVPPLVGELRSHTPGGQKTRTLTTVVIL